ncbi:MAG: phospho-sugar mutase, partial [Verrucomicrobia bacterium]|nr:phospho-sugar mutase [Verrucomicrobiota bacterium]
MSVLADLDATTKANVEAWLQNDFDAGTKEEIERLLREDPQTLTDSFYQTLTFGTAGLRGLMGVGSNRMNVYTVGGATQGLANYLKKTTPSARVLIGYDSRHHSHRFAETAARVLANNGIQVYLFEALRPVPLVSFGVRHLRCNAGIMITASHNPPLYNGYKVYWSDGAQVLPPHDKGIIHEVEAIVDLASVKSAPATTPLITYLGDQVEQAYFTETLGIQRRKEQNQTHGKELQIVYTSLHGTGITMVPKLLELWGFPHFQLVAAQCIPDGNFPTAKSPNPEETEAMRLGTTKLTQVQGDILIGTDPDADRIGVGVWHQGKVELLNGNE